MSVLCQSKGQQLSVHLGASHWDQLKSNVGYAHLLYTVYHLNTLICLLPLHCFTTFIVFSEMFYLFLETLFTDQDCRCFLFLFRPHAT